MMKLTKEQLEKMGDNLDKIKAYVSTLQPEIMSVIKVDFGDDCHIYIDRDKISGVAGLLNITFERKEKESSSAASAYKWSGYSLQLLENWQLVKKSILNEMEKQKATIKMIENFEV